MTGVAGARGDGEGFATHHVSISVRELEVSAAFYQLLGFRQVLLWEAEDQSLRIAHFALGDGRLVEMFAYAQNQTAPPAELPVGNDLEKTGLRHFGLCVPDITAARQLLIESGCKDVTAIKRGRTMIDFFYVRDPDGTWIEIVQDDRRLSSDQPTRLQQ
jgi:glyoxylase I family protein